MDRPADGDPQTPPTRAPSPYVHFLDPRDSRPVNPNTPEGEIRNMAAFAAGVHGISPVRRAVAKTVVWLILIGIALGVLISVLDVSGLL